jgi:IS30 family transposase
MLLWRRRTTSPLNALVILKIQVHRDGGKELADHRRFTLATNIEVYLCDPQKPVAARVESYL